MQKLPNQYHEVAATLASAFRIHALEIVNKKRTLSRIGDIFPAFAAPLPPNADFKLSQNFIVQTVGGLLMTGQRGVAVECLESLADSAWESIKALSDRDRIAAVKTFTDRLVHTALTHGRGIHPDFPQIAKDTIDDRIETRAQLLHAPAPAAPIPATAA